MKEAPRGAFFHLAAECEDAMNARTLLTDPVTSARKTMWSRDLALPFEPWAVLWVAAVAAPWLLPTHMIPWRAFHADWLMALVLLPGAFWAALRRREVFRVPLVAFGVLSVACIPLLQFAGGMMTFAGDAWVAAIYLFGLALAIVTGARFQQVAPGRLVDTLFAAFAVAGLVSVGIALWQWLRLSPLRWADFDFILHYPGLGYRPFGNLGQSNHLATLLVWSLIAVWWAYLSGRVRGAVAIGAAAFLIVGITATQSRTAWLEMAVLLAGAALWHRPLKGRRCLPALIGLALLAVALAASWATINRVVDQEAARSLSAEMSAGLRPSAWWLFVDAALQRPWFGWGWNQIALAQSSVALDHPSLHYSFQNAHNVVLDLVVQNGLPLGLLIALGLAAWILAKARRVDTAAACLLWLAVTVLGVHALLEFPQNYAYFLLPAGLMIGALEAMCPQGAVWPVNRWAIVGALALAAVSTAWVGIEYNIAERNLERLRFERAHVGPSRNSQAPDLVLLTQLREFLRALRLRPEAGMSEDQLELMRRVTRQYPSDGNHLMLAAMEGLNGKPDQAARTLERMCRMVPAQRCRDALATWGEMAKTTPALAKVVVPSSEATQR
jgi:O-antigen ligase